MGSDNITRPPSAVSDVLRTTPATGIPAVKREKERDEHAPEQQTAADDNPAEPVDEIDLSATAIDGFDHPDAPDAYHMTLGAVRDLINQHRETYDLPHFNAMLDQIAFLDTHRVPTIFWPPHLALQDAIIQACALISTA